ncbi:MAG: peptidoglycan DD-metalloendopeptidase family protein [Betaproteobacteria bacterium]|nr:peptidoglycan DD-metalloendopeptidase family protein [Betaproteobacteria bacterium]
MNIILVSDSLARSRNMTLSQTQVILVALGILMSGFFLAMATYVVTMKFSTDLRNPYVRSLLAALHEEDLKRSESEMRNTINSLAVKVGELQARILRLDAFGERLGKAAGIKPSEFRFDEKPGQGGPAPSASYSRDLTLPEFRQKLDEISRILDDRSDKLGVLDSVFMDDRLARKTIPTTLPVRQGFYSSNYGYRIDPISGRSSFHTGVDIIASLGTQVMAAAGGVVSAVEFHPEYGNIVDIDHDNGLTSRYAHLLKASVKVGDVVMKGQLIAQVGTTGRTTGPHLHFEVREKGVPLNPNKFLALDKKEGTLPVAFRK